MSKFPKSRQEWVAAALHQWWIKVAVSVLTVCVGWILAQGKGVVEKKILHTVQPAIDSLQGQVDSLETKVDRALATQQEMFGAMMEADSTLRKAVQARGTRNAEAARKKAETEQLLDNLTGDSK